MKDIYDQPSSDDESVASSIAIAGSELDPRDVKATPEDLDEVSNSTRRLVLDDDDDDQSVANSIIPDSQPSVANSIVPDSQPSVANSIILDSQPDPRDAKRRDDDDESVASSIPDSEVDPRDVKDEPEGLYEANHSIGPLDDDDDEDAWTDGCSSSSSDEDDERPAMASPTLSLAHFEPEDLNRENNSTGPLEDEDDEDASTDGASSSSSDEEDVQPAISSSKGDQPPPPQNPPQPPKRVRTDSVASQTRPTKRIKESSSLNPPGGEGSASGSGSASAANSPSPPPELPQKSSQTPKRVQTDSGASQTGPAKPLKQRGTHNRAYMDLLNQHIIDAVEGIYLEPQDMPPSQIVRTVWTTAEKDALYNALCRFGRHNTPAIAKRIKTKTQFEVAQYLDHLEASCAELVDNPENGDPEQPILSLPADIPAAVEISTDCCDALEREADRQAILQEKQEQAWEKERWGDDNWLITKANLVKMERMQGQLRKKQTQQLETVEEEEEEEEEEASASVTTKSATTKTTAAKTKGKSADARSKDMPKLIKSLEFFKVKNFLEVSERVFMNSARQEPDGSGNWMTMPTGMLEEENVAGTPAIRTSCLEDFYSVAVGVTRKIIGTAVYISGSRVDAKQGLRARETKNVVYSEDVDAAVASIGFRSRRSRNEYWGDAPRRLGLHVVKGDTVPLAAAEEVELMGIGEVERALMPRRFNKSELEDADEQEEEEEVVVDLIDTDEQEEVEEEDMMDTDGQEEVEEVDLMDIDEQEGEEEEDESEEEREIKNEMAVAREVAHPFNIDPDVQMLMRTRIRAAREQEAYADRLDVKASAEEEKRLWAFFESRWPSRSATAAQEGGDKDAEEEQIRPPPAMSGSVEELYEYLGDAEVRRDTMADLHVAAAARWELEWMLENEGEDSEE